MRVRTYMVLSILFLTISISTPRVFATSNVALDLPQTSCNLFPLAGTTYCEVGTKGTMLNAATALVDTDVPMTLSWSHDTTHFSVTVTGYTCGSPCHPYTMTNPQTLVFSDNRFDFKVTYIASTCQNGQYQLTFTLVGHDKSTDQKTFTMNVHCALAPWP